MMKLFRGSFLSFTLLAVGFMAAGYNGLVGAAPGGAAPAATKTGFEPKAPHGGVLLDAGDDFAHVEMVFDPSEGTLSAYILDGEAEEAVPLKQSSITVRLTHAHRLLKLRALVSPLTGEKPGATSSYSLTSPALRGLSGLRGVLVKVAINGRVFNNMAFRFPKKGE